MNISPRMYYSTQYIKLDPIPDVSKACVLTSHWIQLVAQGRAKAPRGKS